MSTGGANTLNTLDRLSGGAGTDSLGTVLATSVTPSSLSSIENVSATATATVTLGLANAADVKSVTNAASTGALTVSGIAAGATLAVQSTGLPTDFQYASTTGTQDVALEVSGVTGAAGITIAGVETVTTTASGTSSYTLTTAGAGTLKFAGSAAQTVALGAGVTGVSLFDASSATGAVSLTLANQSALAATTKVTVTGGAGSDSLTVSAHTASDVSVSGGAGNDTITQTAAATTDLIDGGDGTDTLITNSASANTLDAVTPTTYLVTSIETLTINDQLDASTNSLATGNIATSISRVNLYNAGNTGLLVTGAGTIVGPAGAFTLGIGTSVAGNTAGSLGQNLTVTDTGSATTDSLTLIAGAVNSTAPAASINAFGVAVTSNGYESVTLNSGSTAGAEQEIATLTITPDSLSANVSLTVTGANPVDISTSLTTTSTGRLTVDASGLTAQAAGTTTFDINAISQGTGGTASIIGSAGDDAIAVILASTVLGGAGNDTLAGSSAADSIDGGAGIDTITDGGGNDTILGNDGNDSITISGTSVSVDGGAGNDTINADATLSSGDTVAGGDGTDTLAIDAAATASSSQGVTGFEILRADTALSQDMVQFTTNTGFTRLVSNVAGAVSFTNVGSGTNELRAVTSGGNTTTFDRLLDNSANALTVGTATDANTTLNNLTADDEETISFVAGGATTAGRTFAVTTLTAGDLVTLNVSGNTVFSTTIASQSTAVLTTVNAAASTGTVSISATNATLALTMSGSATAASTLVGGSGADVITGGAVVDSLTGGTGADTISGGGGADILLGGGNADSITGGEGADVITGGTGNDTIDLTETTAAADSVVLEAVGSNGGVDTIVGFAAGTGADTITFVNADTTVPTATGAAAFETVTVTTVTGATYDLGTANAGTAATMDVYELLGTNASNGDLSASTTGSELLKLLGTADSAATSITTEATGDAYYVVAYDNGNAYIYNVNAGGNSVAVAAEITLVAVLTGQAVDALTSGDILTT